MLFGNETTGTPEKYIFVPYFNEFAVAVDTTFVHSLKVNLNMNELFLAKM